METKTNEEVAPNVGVALHFQTNLEIALVVEVALLAHCRIDLVD